MEKVRPLVPYLVHALFLWLGVVFVISLLHLLVPELADLWIPILSPILLLSVLASPGALGLARESVISSVPIAMVLISLMVARHYDTGYWAALIARCLLSPLAEELVFRGYLFKGFRHHYGFWPSAAAAATLFMGLAFAAVYEVSDRLRYAVWGHALFNLVHTVKSLV